jgi:hypothetical protein
MGCRDTSRGEKSRAGLLVEIKEAIAIKIDLCLLKMGAFPDPQVVSSVCYEKCENNVATKDNETQDERPGQN